MRIALATCRNLPDWEQDDLPFHAALADRGVEVLHPVWDDPDFDWASCDACLIRTTWDYAQSVEQRAAYVAWAQRVAKLTLLFNPADIVRWNTDKSYLRDLAGRGVPTVPTVWLGAGSTADLGVILTERGWRSAFIKPAVGATSRETLRFGDDGPSLAAGQRHLDRLLPAEDLLVQPYLSSVETEGELSVIFIDGQISHAVRKQPLPGDYRTQDDYGASDRPVELNATEAALARQVVSALGWKLLYARTDFLRDDAGQLRLTELELTEPSLFFRHGPGAARRLAEALCRRVEAALRR